MLRTVEEFELSRTQETPGVYAFHLRALRRASVGLTGKGPFENDVLVAAKSNCERIFERILQLETQRTFSGSLSEPRSYPAHGRIIDVSGQVAYTQSLRNKITTIPLHDIPGFVRGAEAIATLLPPLYVGITIEQSVQARYEQHKRDHSNRKQSTFGGRLADQGFHWADILFSFVPQAALNIRGDTLKTLEDYIQLLARPRLGIS